MLTHRWENHIRRVTYTSLFCWGILAMCFATKTFAADGSVSIEQTGTANAVGTWELTAPSGLKQFSAETKDFRHHVNISESGSYILDIDAPEGAITSVSVFKEEGEVQKTAETRLPLQFSPEKQYRVVIAYQYLNSVTIDSEPSGVPFELESPYDYSYSGITPATFTNMPPIYFTARYGDIDGCATPKPQRRASSQLNTITFFGRYDCSPKVVETTPNTSADASVRGSARIALTANQTEVIPGSTVTLRIAASNNTKRTIGDNTVSLQIDGEKMSVSDVALQGGTRQGNVIYWEVDKLLAGKTWTLDVPVRVVASIQEGETVSAYARLSGPDVIADVSVLGSSVTVGAPVIPATGYGVEVAFALLSLGGVLILTIQQRRKITTRIRRI